ncbi:hypothetical protein FRC10_005954 [Ceratobasidium sp. 414]|nr:hypothetical protein FRC10_005954 [Ceratobasidium sp. 414]
MTVALPRCAGRPTARFGFILLPRSSVVMPPPLDKNLFTLTIESSKEEAGATDLIDSDGVAVYRRRWGDSKEGSYAVNIFGRFVGLGKLGPFLRSIKDPLSDSLLATVTAANATSKNKVIELHNPTIKIDLNFTGRLSFKWEFKWEDHEFEWKKDECYLLRKPDPPVLVAVSESEKKNKKAIVQFLDYNLSRFDVEDRRGLEVVLVASLLSFQDQSDEYRSRAAAADAASGGLRAYSRQPSSSGSVPTLPPKPGEAMVVKLQSSHQREPNEIVVGSEGAIDEYVDLACNLLQDDSMMFIMIRALDAAQVQRVVQVAEETKRTRRRARYEEELHQYLRYEDEKQQAPKGPKVIKLDESPSKEGSSSMKSYTPPKTLTIHLSKIPMPELMPLAPPPKPAHPSQKAPNLKPPPDSDSPPTARPVSQANSPIGHRSSFFGSLGGSSKNTPSGALNSAPTYAPRPGGVSAHNPYNPYVRPPRPTSPTLANATPAQQKLQKPKPGPGRVSSDNSQQVPYASHPEAPPGSYPHTPLQQWGTGPPSPAPPSMPGQPSTIQDFVKDGVSSFGSGLFSKFSTRK